MPPSREITKLPFTLAHPAAALPLLRRPFVPSALAAGAMAPDAPYFLRAAGIYSDSAQDWYEPFLNATNTHSSGWGLGVNLLFALGLTAAYRLLRKPVTALLPAGLGLPDPRPTSAGRAGTRYALWLLLSAFIGIVSHLAWDSFTHHDGYLVTHVALLRASGPGGLTVDRVLQYVSTVAGLAAIGICLWRRRDRLRTERDTVARLRPAARWCAVAVLVGAAVLGGSVQARDDYHAYRFETVVDYSRPIERDLGDGYTETSYPSRTVKAPWGTVTEGVLTGAAKRAGAASAAALLLFCAVWHTRRLVRTNP
ncbi:DUF4184 family protein [Streptomyces sp. NPDC059063]|uniref:DUF4184 family protein n=1 Tax=unclassified Streptomyces TaxID=2593676 RepID=UPI003675BD07